MIDAFKYQLSKIIEACAICPPVHGKKLRHVTIWCWLKTGLDGVRLGHVHERGTAETGNQLPARGIHPKAIKH